MKRVVVPVVNVALAASGLVGVAVVSAPPAAAALTCPGGWSQSGNQCYQYFGYGQTSVTMPTGASSVGYTVKLVGGGGGGGGGYGAGGTSSLYGQGGSAGSLTTFTSYSSVLTFSIGAGGAAGVNAPNGGSLCNMLSGSDAPTRGSSGGDTTSEGYTASGGTFGSGGGYTSFTQAGAAGPISASGAGGNGGYGCDGYTSGATAPTAGANGTVQVVITMATVQANTPSVTANTNATLTVTASAPTAFPAVTSYEASCSSSDGGAAATGSSSSSPITVTGVTRGKNYTCQVRAYNGDYGSYSSSSTSVLVPGVPWNLGGADLPSVSGTPAYIPSNPQVLTGTTGTWQTPGGYPISGYTYAWQSSANCSTGWSTAAGSPTNASTYTVVQSDAGKCLRVGVTATNSFGTSDPVYSAASAVVTSPPAFTSASPPVVADEGYFAGYTFAASGNRITYSIDSTAPLTGLPAGMSINGSTGALTGTPNAGTAGVFTYKVVATNDSGTASTSTLTLTVSSGTASTLTFTTQPAGGGRSGAVLPTQPVLELKDSAGRLIAQPAAVVATVSAGGTLGGTTSVSTSSGVVTYTNLTLAGLVNINYTLTFTSGSVTAVSNPLQVTPGDVASIEILTEPVAAPAAGDVMATQPVVRLKDAQGNVVNDRSETVSVSSVLASSTSTAAGAVTGSQAAGLATTSGTVTFTNLAFGGTIGTNYKLKFANGAVTALSQNVASTQAGPAAKLNVQTQPGLNGSQLVGSAFTTQPVVRILDTGDNLTTSTATVTATSSGGTLGGTSEVAGVSGTVTFTDLTFAGLIGTNYTLTFTSPGLTPATSNAFQFANASQKGPVSAGTSTITSSDAGLAADGVDTATITVQMKDAGGNNLTASQGVVALAATVGVVGSVTDNNNGTYTATYTSPSSRGTGEAVISGTLAGNAITDTATIALYTTQTITFPQPANVVLGTLPYALDASASSGLAVTFTSATGAVCTVTSGGIVTILTTGNCQINADQAGDSIYWPAPQASKTFVVSATTPTAPFVTSIVEGNAQATVAFTAPGFNGGSAIINYEYSLDGGTTWASGASATSPITITGLTNGDIYRVNLRAVNGIGPGLASLASSAFTPQSSGGTTVTIPTTTPSAPRNAQVTAEPSTTATVSWQEPLTNGGVAITSYSVTMGPSGTCTASIEATSRVGSCTVTGLTPGVTYTFTIVAVNTNGNGDAAVVAYTVPGGGGGGGGGGGTGTDPGAPASPGTTDDDGSGDSDTTGGGGGGTTDGGRGGGKPLPPRFETPDGPTKGEERKLNELPTSKDVKGLPPSTPVPGSGPVPAKGWIPPGGNSTASGGPGTGSAYANDLSGRGFRVLDPSSAEVSRLSSSGTPLRVIVSPGTQGYATSWRYAIKANTMLQVLMPVQPANLTVPFALWVQDRTGEWTSIGTTTLVDGQIVMPVLLFAKPGVYQVVATSMDVPTRMRATANKPTWGTTTVRTIVTVGTAEMLGTSQCPNAVGFTADSAKLNRADKSELQRLARCLGATQRITVSGFVHGYTNAKNAKALAEQRAKAVRSYLRDVGFNGRVVVDQSITRQPADCRAFDNRCALVEMRTGKNKSMELAPTETSMEVPTVGSEPTGETSPTMPQTSNPDDGPPGAAGVAGEIVSGVGDLSLDDLPPTFEVPA